MSRDELLFSVRRALLERDAGAFFEALARNAPATDMAEALDALTPGDCVALLDMLAPAPRAQLFSHIDPKHQDAILAAMPRADVVALFEQLPSDDRADIYNRMDAEQRAQVVPALAQIERDDILKLASYAEGTIGSVTTSDYVAIRAHLTAEQALQVLSLIHI